MKASDQNIHRQKPIKIFVFEKNEIDILKDWIDYHAKIVGYENIVVIDHKSDDGSFNLAKSYQDRGLTAIRYTGPYTNKGAQMTHEMKKFRENSSILIPLDEPTAKKPPSNAQSQSPQEPISVEQIEINDVIYLLHENRIYNKKTGLPVGKIDVGVVILNGVPITLKTKKIIHISDNQYRDRDNNVYELHKDLAIAKAIGEYDNGEVLVFA